MRLALYQPDIPQNTGTILRLCGCLGIEAHIIEPAGFPSTDRAFRRSGTDYLKAVAIIRHASWQDFETWRQTAACRIILFTTKAAGSYLDFGFAPDDILLFGRESAGVPEAVHAAADARLLIPMRRACARSMSLWPPRLPPAKRCGKPAECWNRTQTPPATSTTLADF